AWAAGKFGSALKFDGTSNYVVVPQSASLSLNGSITLEAWVKLDTWGAPSDLMPLIAKWNDVTSANGRSYALSIVNGRVRLDISHDGFFGGSCTTATFYQFVCSSSAYVTSGPYLSLGRWTHVAGVFDSSTKKLQVFIDGVPDTSVIAQHSNVFEVS